MSRIVKKYKNRLAAIDSGLEQEAYRILANVQDQVTELNKAQLKQGLTPLGQKLSPKYRNIRYARAKNTVNPLPGFGTPDLKFTGRFQSNFYLTASNKKFDIFSSDAKTDKLIAKYGKENIFGLTIENNEIVNYEILLPKLMTWVLSKLKI